MPRDAACTSRHVKFPAFGEITGVSTPGVQGLSLTLGKPPVSLWCQRNWCSVSVEQAGDAGDWTQDLLHAKQALSHSATSPFLAGFKPMQGKPTGFQIQCFLQALFFTSSLCKCYTMRHLQFQIRQVTAQKRYGFKYLHVIVKLIIQLSWQLVLRNLWFWAFFSCTWFPKISV